MQAKDLLSRDLRWQLLLGSANGVFRPGAQGAVLKSE
jgi:hypothetical protein